MLAVTEAVVCNRTCSCSVVEYGAATLTIEGKCTVSETEKEAGEVLALP